MIYPKGIVELKWMYKKQSQVKKMWICRPNGSAIQNIHVTKQWPDQSCISCYHGYNWICWPCACDKTVTLSILHVIRYHGYPWICVPFSLIYCEIDSHANFRSLHSVWFKHILLINWDSECGKDRRLRTYTSKWSLLCSLPTNRHERSEKYSHINKDKFE